MISKKDLDEVLDGIEILYNDVEPRYFVNRLALERHLKEKGLLEQSLFEKAIEKQYELLRQLEGWKTVEWIKNYVYEIGELYRKAIEEEQR